ncbi:MAG: carbohydrate kinase [Planctomycetia bacterium]
MKDKPLLVGIGEVLWDLLPEGKQLGGAPGNFAYHANAQGGRGVVVSCIGDDPLGQEIADQIRQLDLTTDYLAVDPDHPTGTVSIELDEQGKPTYIIHHPVAWDFLPSRPELLTLAEETDAVCFGSLAQRNETSRETIRAFLDHTPSDSLRIFDINLRQEYYDQEILTAGLKAATILKLNDEELPVLGRMFSIRLPENVLDEEGEAEEDTALRILLKRFGLDLIALTKGSDGAKLITPDDVANHPGVPVEVADTVGAGDSFTAALAMGRLEGRDLATILQRATQIAAFVCSSHGATPNYDRSDFLKSLRKPGDS